jgi:hypothetical protein
MNLTDEHMQTCWSGGICHRKEDCDEYHTTERVQLPPQWWQVKPTKKTRGKRAA